MMTQREKLQVLLPKMKAHSFFEQGPYMISKKESEAIIKAMEYHFKNLERGHERYLENQDENIKKAQERYKRMKMEAIK